ncbi:MAG: hypothetical protein JSR21_17440 [Proteobacteria bacterium]|nr:hypothetical protein [Pseudomonadota bacterium]
MPDDKWLWNQPKNWHEIGRALRDIEVLLGYLGTQPDGRLLAYFADTQSKVGDGAAKRTVPPCASYPQFLDLITQISAAFETGDERALPKNLPAQPGGTPVSAEGFVFWARDFLAAVAAPATADSILLTREYVHRRSASWLRLPRLRRRDAAAPAPVRTPDPDAPMRLMLAARLARWVGVSETLTVATLLLTVAISIYALSGRLILDNTKDAEAAWAKIDAALEAQETLLVNTRGMDASAGSVVLQGLCKFEDTLAKAAQPKEAERAAAEGAVRLASNAPETPIGVPSASDAPPPGVLPVSARQVHLCKDSAKALQDLFFVTLHLQSWSSIATRRIGHFADLPMFGHTVPIGLWVAPLLGVSSTSIAEFVPARDGTVCDQAATDLYDSAMYAPTERQDACKKVLLAMIDRTHRVAEAILGSLTLYILPVFYAFLGAMAATLRRLRQKVDNSLLAYTDRALLQQGALLGVLCGGVIGLFAAYVGNASPTGGIGLSAVALLAGYNVDGVFRFLDNLSDRIFRPSDAPKPG